MPARSPEAVVRHVAGRIGELRREAGFTQAEAAERFGTALKNWQRIEAGQNVTVHTLARIATLFGTDCAAFFAPKIGTSPSPSRPRRKK